MRTLIFTTLALLLPLTASAQKIEAKSKVINVGQVMFRQPVTVDYVLHNRSTHSMLIDKVRTSCGCTTVD